MGSNSIVRRDPAAAQASQRRLLFAVHGCGVISEMEGEVNRSYLSPDKCVV